MKLIKQNILYCLIRGSGLTRVSHSSVYKRGHMQIRESTNESFQSWPDQLRASGSAVVYSEC